MNNPMQLKAKIKNLSKKTGLPPNVLIRQFFLERILERISLSEYKDIFILKSGF